MSDESTAQGRQPINAKLTAAKALRQRAESTFKWIAEREKQAAEYDQLAGELRADALVAGEQAAALTDVAAELEASAQ